MATYMHASWISFGEHDTADNKQDPIYIDREFYCASSLFFLTTTPHLKNKSISMPIRPIDPFHPCQDIRKPHPQSRSLQRSPGRYIGRCAQNPTVIQHAQPVEIDGEGAPMLDPERFGYGPGSGGCVFGQHEHEVVAGCRVRAS